MDRDDVEEIVRGMLAERDRRQPVDDDQDDVRHMMAIEPFDAEDIDDKPCRVIGVAYRNDSLDWVVTREVEYGELVPDFAGGVWKKPAA